MGENPFFSKKGFPQKMIGLYLLAIEDTVQKRQFEQVYMEHRDVMYRYAYRILQDEASAEDAVHDSFLSLAKNYERYQQFDCNRMRSFLIITVRNASFKIYNRRKRETAVEDIYADCDTKESLPDVSYGAEQRNIKDIIFRLVKSLDPKYGDVVMLKYYCELSVNEIAQQLELTPENVKVRLHRARALLKTKLEGAGIIEGS